MWRKRLYFFIIVVASFTTALLGSSRFSGMMFGDFFYIPDHHREDLAGMNGWWIRRIYFTYDNKLSERFAIRFRLEARSPGDFETRDVIKPFVKDAYIKYKTGLHSFYAGLIPTPTWANVEKIWGYRAVEKTPADLFKIGSSRELGIGAKGALDRAGRFNYWFVFGNGEGKKSEVNPGKKVLMSIFLKPKKGILLEVYGDYAKETSATSTTAHLFAAYEKKDFRAGIQYIYHIRSLENYEDIERKVLSIFSCVKIHPKVGIFGRYDHLFNANPDGSRNSYMPFYNGSPLDLVLLGLDYKLHRKISLIPNLAWVQYREEDPQISVGHDLYFKITFYARW